VAALRDSTIKERKDAHVGPVLPERAPSEGPRPTAAPRPTWVPFQERETSELGGSIRHYATHEEAKPDIFEYIEVFYNRKRRHSTLGYQSLAEYEARTAVA
jgi:transposase InsO family protein